MRRVFLATVLLALAACRTERSSPAIALNATAGTIEVRGASPGGDLRERFTVRSGPASAPAMLGDYEQTNGAIVFRPRYPLVPGIAYRVRFGDTETTIVIPKNTTATTRVAQIHPASGVLPANQLKFYLDFSAPMSTGDVYRNIHLLDANGDEVQRAFLTTAHEMWDAQRKRFTLILDPGRIKRGLRANVESGTPLREGASYRLVVDAAWRDGDGNPLREPFAKSFRVGSADRTMPDPSSWRITEPVAGTRDAVRVTFDEPLDRALLEQMIAIRDANGATIAGDITIHGNEDAWELRPQQPWSEGAYVVDVHPLLEDRAGNNLQRLFDRVVGEEGTPHPPSAPSPLVREGRRLEEGVRLPFTSRRRAAR